MLNGWTVFAQHTVSNVTITIREFDEIYAPALVKAIELTMDTSILHGEILILQKRVANYQKQISDDSLMFLNQGKIVNAYKKENDDLTKKYNRQVKITRFFRSASVIFLSTTVILSTILVLH